MTVTEVMFTPAPDGHGLLGYVACRVDDLLLDGLALRRTRGGKLTVTFPCRRDRHGRMHPLVRPVGPGVEAAILAALAGEVP